MGHYYSEMHLSEEERRQMDEEQKRWEEGRRNGTIPPKKRPTRTGDSKSAQHMKPLQRALAAEMFVRRAKNKVQDALCYGTQVEIQEANEALEEAEQELKEAQRAL